MKANKQALVKVIAHLHNHKLVKGYTDVVPSLSPEELLQRSPAALPQKITLQAAETRKRVTVPMKSLKALFFVKTFEGKGEYREVKFFDGNPSIEGLWVRMRFFDSEFTEGVVHNSLHYLLNPGFFLKPPDPESNNRMVYVVKSALIEFRVMGVSSTY
ncbi:MAG: hypothetical protein ACE5IP_09975 [Terriglobia bacterium]